MNFLSHFYFDRNCSDPDRVAGTVLPDLVKNAKKEWNLRPEKRLHLFTEDSLRSILAGWNRHLEVDKHFHNSDFFRDHTRLLRELIAPVLVNSAVRPSFLAHISLEIMLDSILLTESVVHAEDLYRHLSECNRVALAEFLKLNGLPDIGLFMAFFDKFIESGYLNSYRESHNIMYALNRICMRIWPEPISETQLLQLSSILLVYRAELQSSYLQIFDEITAKLEN